MKYVPTILVAFMLTFALCGCVAQHSDSDDAGSSQETSASSSSSKAKQAQTSKAYGADMLGTPIPVHEPPIKCGKQIDLGNVTIHVPKKWKVKVDEGAGTLNITGGKNISGTMTIQDYDTTDVKSEEDLQEFVGTLLNQAKENGYFLEEKFAIEHIGNLIYTIIPYSAEVEVNDGKMKEFWGYSYCGYDNELIVFELTTEKENADVLATFRWIMENLKVN